jgi:hypothetical protein
MDTIGINYFSRKEALYDDSPNIHAVEIPGMDAPVAR